MTGRRLQPDPPRPGRSRRLAILGLALVSGAFAACSTGPTPADERNALVPSPSPAQESGSQAPSSSPEVLEVTPYKPVEGIFGDDSEWRRNISDAPLSEDSEALVDNLASQVSVRYGGTAAFNDHDYNVSFYAVPAGHKRVDVAFDDCQSKGYEPSALFDPSEGAHFLDVPIPDSAQPATGSDGELSIWDPSTDQLWEFWKANKQDDGWHACWGGRIDDVSTSPGYFANYTGVAASGLSVSGGDVGIEEMKAGSVNHAMSLNVVDAAHYSLFSYPAQRSDGNLPVEAENAIMEGQRFRLDPRVDVEALALTPIAKVIARAAQTYGFIVNDRSGAVSVIAEDGGGLAAAGGVDPWVDLKGGVPSYEILKNFPWDRLQALPIDYGE